MKQKANKADVLAKYDAGMAQADIAREFGISRERVRQIVNKAGKASPRQKIADRDALVVASVTRLNLSKEELADRFPDLKGCTLNAACRRYGVKPPLPKDMIVRRAFVQDKINEFLKGGKSLRSVCNADLVLEAYCRRMMVGQGCAPEKRYRADDNILEKRLAIVQDEAANGGTYKTLLSRINDVEGHNHFLTTITNFCRRYAPKENSVLVSNGRVARQKTTIKKERIVREKVAKVRRENPARITVQNSDVIIKGTDKETAIANYGRVPASRIAEAIGQTRNSIIGHWFRARNAGLICAAISKAEGQ